MGTELAFAFRSLPWDPDPAPLLIERYNWRKGFARDSWEVKRSGSTADPRA
jgi:hypothetical protein